MADDPGDAHGEKKIELPRSALASIAAVPRDVVHLLNGDKLLLTAMGTSCVIAVVAVAVPDLGLGYAVLIAGLVLLLVVIRALTESRRRGPRYGGRDNVVSTVGKIRARDARIDAPGSNVLRSLFGVRLRGVDLRAGVPQPETPRTPNAPNASNAPDATDTPGG
jgi:hypothetical protein